MIPYEELVIALQTWRAKQGLPVGQLSGALTPPPPAPPPPQRAGPPVAPPRMGGTGPQAAFGGNVAPPPPLAAPEESLDVDESALIDEAHYENEGNDFAMEFAGAAAPGLDDGESTSIGNVPDPRGSQTTLDDAGEAPPPSNRNRNDDW
jgi:hypothetical protein